MRWGSVKVKGYAPHLWAVNGFGMAPPKFRLDFGETWWGNRQGKHGTRPSRGRVLYRCASTPRVLTCRHKSGSGFSFSRSGEIRVF